MMLMLPPCADHLLLKTHGAPEPAIDVSLIGRYRSPDLQSLPAAIIIVFPVQAHHANQRRPREDAVAAFLEIA